MLNHLSVYPKKIKKYVRSKLKPNVGNGEFAKRIRHRHKIFWTEPDPEIVKNIMNSTLSVSEPLEKWHDIEFWQRKLANKYNSREFAKMYNCNVPELYWKGRDIETLNLARLPKQFVIRPITGHSSRGIFLMDEGINLMEKRAYTNEELKEALGNLLIENAKLEFLIEEFVKTEKGEYEIPKDYKFYTFNGEIATIQVNSRSTNSTKTHNSYDIEWNKITNTVFTYKRGEEEEPPKCLAEMIEQVKLLSKAYEIFVRIDFYATDKGPVFGEFTATPSRGDFYSVSANKRFAIYWDKFCAGKI